MKALILHLLNGRLSQAIEERRKLAAVLAVIDRWIGTGTGSSEDRKVLRSFLDKEFPLPPKGG